MKSKRVRVSQPTLFMLSVEGPVVLAPEGQRVSDFARRSESSRRRREAAQAVMDETADVPPGAYAQGVGGAVASGRYNNVAVSIAPPANASPLTGLHALDQDGAGEWMGITRAESEPTYRRRRELERMRERERGYPTPVMELYVIQAMIEQTVRTLGDIRESVECRQTGPYRYEILWQGRVVTEVESQDEAFRWARALEGYAEQFLRRREEARTRVEPVYQWRGFDMGSEPAGATQMRPQENEATQREARRLPSAIQRELEARVRDLQVPRWCLPDEAAVPEGVDPLTGMPPDGPPQGLMGARLLTEDHVNAVADIINVGVPIADFLVDNPTQPAEPVKVAPAEIAAAPVRWRRRLWVTSGVALILQTIQQL